MKLFATAIALLAILAGGAVSAEITGHHHGPAGSATTTVQADDPIETDSDTGWGG